MNGPISPQYNEGASDIKNNFISNHETEQKAEIVDLNIIIKEVFSVQRKRLEALKVISRCDILPIVESNFEKLKTVLSKLINIILDNPPAKNKLFLYIKCEMKQTEVMDLTLPKGCNYYQISFHANTEVCTTPDFANTWQQCEALVKTLPNSFISLSYTNAGCLFSITMPGKLN